MQEIWKDIEEYEGLYQVSNLGRVKSTYGWNAGSKKYCNRELIMKLKISSVGYYVVTLHKDKKQKTHNVHRLVAEAFIPNPYNKETVNHKNGDKINNNIDNLEWCTARYNLTYNGIRKKAGLTNRKRGKCVNMLDRSGAFIKRYDSLTDAALAVCGENYEKGVMNICNACKGRIPTAYGYKWSYA